MVQKCTIVKILLLAAILSYGGIAAMLYAQSDLSVPASSSQPNLSFTSSSEVFSSPRSVEDVIDVICADWTEGSELEIEEIKTTLLDLYDNPIDVNSASSDDLRKIPFLTENQIDDILLYVYRHPMDSIYELLLIPSLRDYEAHDLMFFLTAENPASPSNELYAREVFKYARHELLLRADARNLESFSGDPAYAQLRYRFNYRNRVQFGASLRRNPGTSARDLLYGAYLQLNDFGPLKSLVFGNFQADFGCGLVTASAFHMGKSAYVLNAGMRPEGLRKYSSADGSGYTGIGATFSIPIHSRRHIASAASDLSSSSYILHSLEASAFYSISRANDSICRHVIGVNATYRWNRLKLGLTAVEKLYSDTLFYYRNTAYNRNYFRGTNQAVLGLNARYNWGRYDLFGEVAIAQSSYNILFPRFGFGTNIGLRMTPVDNVGLMLLYRYYSPTFDNDLGYGFSESSRIGDEHGVYLAADVRCVPHWRWSAYVDLFRFSIEKYQINFAPSYGYEAFLQTDWNPNSIWNMSLRGRVREKGEKTTFLIRYQFRWNRHNWLLTTRADYTRGYSLLQDVRYTFRRAPLQLGARLCGFHVPNYDWRIYAYEDDVLESFSIPALYGTGMRAYLNLRWQILDFRSDSQSSLSQLVLYFRASETFYSNSWAVRQNLPYRTKTDLHLLLRLTF